MLLEDRVFFSPLLLKLPNTVVIQRNELAASRELITSIERDSLSRSGGGSCGSREAFPADTTTSSRDAASFVLLSYYGRSCSGSRGRESMRLCERSIEQLHILRARLTFSSRTSIRSVASAIAGHCTVLVAQTLFQSKLIFYFFSR